MIQIENKFRAYISGSQAADIKRSILLAFIQLKNQHKVRYKFQIPAVEQNLSRLDAPPFRGYDWITIAGTLRAVSLPAKFSERDSLYMQAAKTTCKR